MNEGCIKVVIRNITRFDIASAKGSNGRGVGGSIELIECTDKLGFRDRGRKRITAHS